MDTIITPSHRVPVSRRMKPTKTAPAAAAVWMPRRMPALIGTRSAAARATPATMAPM
jgi:hypothetical protein